MDRKPTDFIDLIYFKQEQLNTTYFPQFLLLTKGDLLAAFMLGDIFDWYNESDEEFMSKQLYPTDKPIKSKTQFPEHSWCEELWQTPANLINALEKIASHGTTTNRELDKIYPLRQYMSYQLLASGLVIIEIIDPEHFEDLLNLALSFRSPPFTEEGELDYSEFDQM